MDHVRIVYESLRFATIAVWCGLHSRVESRLTRAEALCDGPAPKGWIVRGLCVSCSLALFLWSKLPCGEWQAYPNVNHSGRPCSGCDRED